MDYARTEPRRDQANRVFADLQEAVRLVCGCGCPTCVDVVSELSADDRAWEHQESPCRLGAGWCAECQYRIAEIGSTRCKGCHER